MRFLILSCLVEARLHAVPQNIPLELRKHGQHPGERSAARGRQVERFTQGHESHVECVQFLERVHQVQQRPPLAIQSARPGRDRFPAALPP